MKISEKIQVKIHSLICNDCRHYETDSQAVNDILKLLSEETGTESLTKTEKDKIKKALQEIKK